MFRSHVGSKLRLPKPLASDPFSFMVAPYFPVSLTILPCNRFLACQNLFACLSLAPSRLVQVSSLHSFWLLNDRKFLWTHQSLLINSFMEEGEQVAAPGFFFWGRRGIITRGDINICMGIYVTKCLEIGLLVYMVSFCLTWKHCQIISHIVCTIYIPSNSAQAKSSFFKLLWPGSLSQLWKTNKYRHGLSLL